MQTRLTIVKVGGKVVEEPESLAELLNDFSKIVGNKILVHGGGRSATAIAAKMGIESKMVDGRRITDKDTLDVVTMVYGGLVNKNIVAQLQSRNINAIGLSGADLDLIRAVKRPVKDIDYGYVGDVKYVNCEQIEQLINAGVTPVVAPLSHDGKGQMLNTNADTIASELAGALARSFKVQLIFCFEKKGVLANPEDENSVISELNMPTYEMHKKSGVINAGMIPKLDNGFTALTRGVQEVLITDVDGLKFKSSTGTRLSLEDN